MSENNTLWKRAKKIVGKGNHKIWLVWTIGKYANGLPWVELRAVYTNAIWANRCAEGIEKYEIPEYNKTLGKALHTRMERSFVEPRVTNHRYGGEMMELAIYRGDE